MSDYFSSLSVRERTLIGVALLVGVLLLGYVFLWQPKMDQLKVLRERQVPQSEQTLAWVKQALTRTQNQSNAAPQIIEGPLLTVIEQTAEQAKVRAAIRRMQPNQQQAVKIWMDGVNFDQWLSWIDLLRQQNVIVEQVSLLNKSTGVVDVRLTLARA